MDLDEVIKRLNGVVRPDYKWPSIPAGWRLEFIAYSNENVDMDLLHPVSAVFWSEDNGHFDPPLMLNGKNITASALKKAGVPFMTTFGVAAVSEEEQKPHLSLVGDGSKKIDY